MRFELPLLVAICACTAGAQTAPQPRIEELKGKTVRCSRLIDDDLLLRRTVARCAP